MRSESYETQKYKVFTYSVDSDYYTFSWARMARVRLMWGAFGLGADNGAQLTGRTRGKTNLLSDLRAL
jgi:hypothetical protein